MVARNDAVLVTLLELEVAVVAFAVAAIFFLSQPINRKVLRYDKPCPRRWVKGLCAYKGGLPGTLLVIDGRGFII